MSDPIKLYSPEGEALGTFTETTPLEYRESVETLLGSLQDRVEMVRRFDLQYEEDKLPDSLTAALSFLNNYEQAEKNLPLDIQYTHLAQNTSALYYTATTRIPGLGVINNSNSDVLKEDFLETYTYTLTLLGETILHNIDCYQAVFSEDYRYFKDQNGVPLALNKELVKDLENQKTATEGMYI